MKLPLRISLMIMFAILALLAAACGTGNEQAAPTAPPGSDEPSALPINPNPGDTPATAGACIEGEPDCNDTVAIGDEPQDLPAPGDDIPPSGGMVVDGGLTVADAMASGSSEPLAVMGFLLIDDKGAQFCELLAESFPPQCGGASVSIEGYEEVLDAPLTSSQDISWTDEPVTFLGSIVDGAFIVNGTVAQ